MSQVGFSDPVRLDSATHNGTGLASRTHATRPRRAASICVRMRTTSDDDGLSLRFKLDSDDEASKPDCHPGRTTTPRSNKLGLSRGFAA